jgi:hypothetical protein
VVVWAWYLVATSFTVHHHSGYHFPLLPSPEFHDWHHYRFRGNYGVLGLMDGKSSKPIPGCVLFVKCLPRAVTILSSPRGYV